MCPQYIQQPGGDTASPAVRRSRNTIGGRRFCGAIQARDCSSVRGDLHTKDERRGGQQTGGSAEQATLTLVLCHSWVLVVRVPVAALIATLHVLHGHCPMRGGSIALVPTNKCACAPDLLHSACSPRSCPAAAVAEYRKQDEEDETAHCPCGDCCPVTVCLQSNSAH